MLGLAQVAADFAFIPFGGGARKCVGDQFALMEATVALAMLLRSGPVKECVRDHRPSVPLAAVVSAVQSAVTF